MCCLVFLALISRAISSLASSICLPYILRCSMNFVINSVGLKVMSRLYCLIHVVKSPKYSRIINSRLACSYDTLYVFLMSFMCCVLLST